MKSAYERYNAIMNGEDIDEDCKEADITVEINVGQCEEELNELENEISNQEELDSKIEEAEMLIRVLRTDGIDPISLSIIKSNKLYNDIWKIALPTVESLNANTNNISIANQLADKIEYKINSLDYGVESILDKMKSTWEKFTDVFRSNTAIVEKLRNQVVDLELDEKKCKNTTVEAYDYKNMSYIASILDDLAKLKIPTKYSQKEDIAFNKEFEKVWDKVKKEFFGLNPNTIEYQKIKISDVAKDITNINDKYYKIVKDLKDREEIYQKKIDQLGKYIISGKISDSFNIKGNNKQNYRIHAMFYIKSSTRFIVGMQKAYIRLAKGVLSCKKS